MIDLLLRLLGFESLSREEAAREIMARDVTFKWRPVIVEERVTSDLD